MVLRLWIGVTSSLLNKLAHFNTFPNYMWDTWLYIICCYFHKVRMDGIRIFCSMVLLCRMLMRIWMKTMQKNLSIKESITMWQWPNFTVINFNIKTLMALHCFGVADWGNNTLWMLMRLLNKTTWSICAWIKKSFVQISIKAFRTPSLLVNNVVPLDKGSFCHLLS